MAVVLLCGYSLQYAQQESIVRTCQLAELAGIGHDANVRIASPQSTAPVYGVFLEADASILL